MPCPVLSSSCGSRATRWRKLLRPPSTAHEPSAASWIKSSSTWNRPVFSSHADEEEVAMSQAGMDGNAGANWQNATKLLFQFDQAWQKGTSPRIEAYLPPSPRSGPAADPLRQKLLEELIKIDLEYCWRKGGQCIESQVPGKSPPVCPMLEDYLERFPELGRREALSLELIGWEYLVRQRWGNRPGQDEYGARFPDGGSQLTQVLDEIDAKLAQEFFPAAKPPAGTDISQQALPKSASPGLPLSAVGTLIDSLRASRVLGLVQLDEL